MKQKVWLTTEPNTVDETVHVDDVIVKDGVYAKTNGIIAYWMDSRMCFIRPDDTTTYKVRYDSFEHAVKCWTNLDLWEVYTLSGTRIVTEKRLTVGDLKNSDHIGFVNPNGKGYILGYDSEFFGIQTKASEYYANYCYGSIKARNVRDVFAVANVDKSMVATDIYKFTTRKELYQWLSE